MKAPATVTMALPTETIPDELVGIGVAIGMFAQPAGVVVAHTMRKAAIVRQKAPATLTCAAVGFIVALTNGAGVVLRKALLAGHGRTSWPVSTEVVWRKDRRRAQG
jgi:hypothetical protein